MKKITIITTIFIVYMVGTSANMIWNDLSMEKYKEIFFGDLILNILLGIAISVFVFSIMRIGDRIKSHHLKYSQN